MTERELGPETDRWGERPRIALAIRGVSIAAPIAFSVAFVSVVAQVFGRPPGLVAMALWWVAITAGATVVLIVAERFMRRLLPLEALFRMSLAFPDQAPSRFKVALKTNTLRQLQRSMAAGDLPKGSAGHQVAAERLLVLATALNSHDRMTRGHTERVRAYTLMIGEAMRLRQAELDRLHWAGLVHDIGKLEVPPALLNKKGKPTDEEWEIIKMHPVAGQRLVEPLRPWLGDWADAASQHHERLDGKGYPYGLVGSEISLAGKIVAVADAYDVMTSIRSYKTAMSPEAARAELTRCAGTQFDEQVVRAFLGISVGRLRLVMGPLSWLAQVLGSGPVGATATTLASSALSVGIAALSGFAVPGTQLGLNPGAAPVRAAVAVPVSVTGLEDTAVAVDAPAQLSPAPTRWKVLRVPGHTRLESSGSSVRLMPDSNYFGDTEGRYEACWGDRCSTSTLLVKIKPVNDVSVLKVDRLSMAEDAVALVDPVLNDTDVEDTRPTLRSVASDARLTYADGSPTVRGGVVAMQPSGDVRFRPPRDFVGTAQISYVAGDRDGAEATGEIVIEVAPVNDAPIAQPDQAVVVGGTKAIINVLANDTDVDGDVLRIASTTSPTFGTLTSDGQRLTFLAPPGPARSLAITYVAEDPDGARSTARVTISVLAGGSQPVATADTFTVAEDAPPKRVDVLANDRDADGLLAEHTVRVVSPPSRGTASFDRQVLVYTPDPDDFGDDSLAYEICDPTGLCGTATVAVRITSVNDAPSFTASRVVTSEDGGPTAIVGWAGAISTGASNESQTVSFTVRATDPSLFSTQPAVASDGTLTYAPAPAANGSTTITATATDDGGTANGGVDTSTARTATITITAVNDAPSFVGGADQVALEDAGTRTVAGWATAMSAGPPDESGQTVSFLVSADDPTLFATQPAVASNGTLTYTPAPNANGTATITVRARDNGGTADGGINTSAGQTATITITAVNDAPSFTVGANPVSLEDAGPRTVAGWATAIVAGPADESGQTVSFAAVADDPTLFATQPALAANGTLTYTAAPNANGTATITVTAQDNGGTANGGDDTSAGQTATISVTAVNDAPSFTVGADQVSLEDAGPQTVPGWATAMSAGPPNESGQTVSFVVLVDDPSLFATQPAVASNGTLTYTVVPNAYGIATITVTAQDDGGTANGGSDASAGQAATITINPVADDPVAADDGYQTPENTSLSVPAPGVLGNDYDEDGDTLSASPALVVGPTNGIVVLVADGSFLYTPLPLFSGTDSFSYRVNDGTGRSAVGTVSIIVDSGLSSKAYFLGTTPSGGGAWGLRASSLPVAGTEPDHDGDSNPGFTLESGGKDPSDVKPDENLYWTLDVSGVPLDLNGPVRLRLWSSINDFNASERANPHVYLYDCTTAGTGCVELTRMEQHLDPYNRGIASWVPVDLSLGNVTYSVPVGRQLRVRVQVEHHDLWIAASGSRPSQLNLTLAGP